MVTLVVYAFVDGLYEMLGVCARASIVFKNNKGANNKNGRYFFTITTI